MDRYLENFLGFKRFGPAIASEPVPEEKVAKFRGKLPNKLLEYWQNQGWCGYADGLFWTVDPDEWEGELGDWIGDTPFMEQDAYYVIGRSAFGELFLWGERTGQSLKVVTPFGMIFPSFNAKEFAMDGPDLAMQLFFSTSSRGSMDMRDQQEKPLFERALAKLGPVSADTLYGFVPALGLGGEPKLENLQIVDAHVHLNIIAQMTDRQTMRDIVSEIGG
jgi:hypothetical protein